MLIHQLIFDLQQQMMVLLLIITIPLEFFAIACLLGNSPTWYLSTTSTDRSNPLTLLSIGSP